MVTVGRIRLLWVSNRTSVLISKRRKIEIRSYNCWTRRHMQPKTRINQQIRRPTCQVLQIRDKPWHVEWWAKRRSCLSQQAHCPSHNSTTILLIISFSLLRWSNKNNRKRKKGVHSCVPPPLRFPLALIGSLKVEHMDVILIVIVIANYFSWNMTQQSLIDLEVCKALMNKKAFSWPTLSLSLHWRSVIFHHGDLH